MLPLLILKTGHTLPVIQAKQGDFEALFAKFCNPDLDIETCSVCDGDPLPKSSQFSGIIISGSPQMVTDPHPWIDVMTSWLKPLIGQLPILGVCFGHQFLAQCLGGKVGYNPRGRQIGTTNVFRLGNDDDPIFSSLPKQFLAQTTHSQCVIQLPSQVTHLAGSDLDQNHAFRYGDNCWGIQFHPEFDAWIIQQYLEARQIEIKNEGLNWSEIYRNTHDKSQGKLVLEAFIQFISTAKIQPQPLSAPV